MRGVEHLYFGSAALVGNDGHVDGEVLQGKEDAPYLAPNFRTDLNLLLTCVFIKIT